MYVVDDRPLFGEMTFAECQRGTSPAGYDEIVGGLAKGGHLMLTAPI